MSAAPQLHYPSDTDKPARAYNSAAAKERPLEAAGMTGTWKRWEGKVVNGKFPLQRYLGGSDHSAVFLTQRGSEQVAIKLVAADPENAEAQLSRWRLAAKLSNPHLLQIFEMGRTKLEETNLLFLVMEFADDDLSKILPQRALTSEEVQEMLKPVLGALGYIHRERCVHGRLRPSNILAVGDQVKVSSDSLSASGEASRLETSVYDAPESASGSISPAADVWSLGVTLVEVLTRRLPDPTQSGHAVLPAGMPPLFQDIARRCLHADPQQRWTVAQIAAHLDPASAASLKTSSSTLSTSRLATPIERKPISADNIHTDKTTHAKWLYVVPVIVAAVVGWFLISASKTTTPQKAPDQSAQVEQPEAQTTSPAQPVPARTEPNKTEQKRTEPNKTEQKRTEPKRSPVMPKAQAARTIPETGNSPSAAVAAAPPASTAKPEAAPPIAGSPIKASTAASSAVPGVVHPVMPVVSHSARSTITGKIRLRVRVKVDTSGNVTAATLDSAGPSKYFARIALEAAQGWKFTPAQAHGQFVPSEWTLRFGFTRSDTEVQPTRIAP